MKLSSHLTRLSLALLKQTADTPTRMISPLSLAEALAMLAEGASGETLRQLEEFLGITRPTLRRSLSTLRTTFAQASAEQLLQANSLWTDEQGFTPAPTYCKRLADRYAAEVHALPLAAPDAALRINGWVQEATGGMIPRLVNEDMLRGLRLLLINALCFEAEWARAFMSHTCPAPFTLADGTAVTADFMHSKCEHLFLSREGAQGFIKPYAEGHFAFAAILPPEGVSAEDYLTGLDGASLHRMLNTPTECPSLHVKMPAFRADYGITLNEALKALGLTRIFSPAEAELDRMGKADGRLCVDVILQKTHIEVNTAGTRAAAATAVTVMTTSLIPPEEYRELVFDRPFLYAILHTDTHTPIFMGVMADPTAKE
ncbi:MAG: serpin family protein [Clostridia bacterium]|nr:serpin family protein [Clostridia bacterium]